jgi:hypothetical protein
VDTHLPETISATKTAVFRLRDPFARKAAMLDRFEEIRALPRKVERTWDVSGTGKAARVDDRAGR